MKRIKLNQYKNLKTKSPNYQLDPTEEYVINIEDELESQAEIFSSFQLMGSPPALKNYHAWLYKNGFDVELPNPTNDFVSQYYGIKPLWETDYSLGIVVMDETCKDDFYIVMECSDKNKGYKHTQVILTPGGCL